MKRMSTCKSLLSAGLFFMAVSSPLLAQTNMVSANTDPSTVLTSTTRSFALLIDERLMKPGLDEVEAISGSAGVTVDGVSREGGKVIVNITVAGGLPVTAGFSFVFNGKPDWHVTVADILGHAEGQGDDEFENFRPLDITDMFSQTTPSSPGSSSISAPPAVTSTPGGKGAQPKMDLFPNPTTEFITIVTEGEVLWGVTEIIDLTGKKILEIPTGYNSPSIGADRVTLMVGQLKPGTYIVRFKTNKSVYTKRFQVSR